MRFEIVDRQRLEHVLLVAHLVFASAAFGQGRLTLLVIGHPTGQAWEVPQHPAYHVRVIDRDLQPRTAEAYTRFAELLGVAADPLFVVVTPHMEPIAAGSSTEFLDTIVTADRDKLLAEAGLAVRRHLLGGGPHPRSDDRFQPGLHDLAKGPLYDHIGGGFFRGIGRFDKSAEDQAKFALLYLSAWKQTRDPLFAEVVRSTLDYALADLQERSGLFVAGANAKSLVARGGPELLDGGYYVWQTSEIRNLLGPKLGEIVIFHYGAKKEGNVPGNPDFYEKSVLVPRPEAETRAKFALTEQELSEALRSARAKLLDVRLKRPKPPWHAPIVTAYNAEMISALARASVAFDEPRYASAATRAARSLRPKALTPRDHALLTQALFDTYQATFDLSVLERALSIVPGEAEKVADPVAPLVPEEEVRAPSLDDFRQIIVAGDPSRDDTQAWIRAARADGAMLFLVVNDRTRRKLTTWMPHLPDIAAGEDGRPAAIVCEKRSCRRWEH